MATVLHLVKSPEVTLVLTSIHHQVAAGDHRFRYSSSHAI